MPVKPQPEYIKCRSCGWSVIFAPISDVLVTERPYECPECSGSQLTFKPAKSINSIIRRIFGGA